MNPLIQHHQESVKEFEKQFGSYTECAYDEIEDANLGDEIKRFFLRDRISFWESEIQRMEGMNRKVNYPKGEILETTDDELMQKIVAVQNEGWNRAIDVMLKLYREAVEWGKEQLK